MRAFVGLRVGVAGPAAMDEERTVPDDTDEPLARFGDYLDAIEKHLALIHQELAAHRAALDGMATAIDRIERRFEASDI